MKNNNIIFCDGGLSNRLNTLLFALVLREKFKISWELAWPINEWCGSSFENLFSIDFPVTDKNLSFYQQNESNFTLLMHENQAGFDESNIVYHSELNKLEDYEFITSSTKPIFYYHNLLPNFTDTSDLQTALKYLKVRPEILLKAYEFCIKNEINNSVLGLHIRKTDFGNLVDDNALYELAKTSDHRFFVCSDDQSVNDKFSQLSNCSVYTKTAFPEQRIPTGNWNSLTVDDQGRAYNFNINRSSESLVEALIDLLILSKTTHILTSNSTFLRMSMIFKSTNYFSF